MKKMMLIMLAILVVGGLLFVVRAKHPENDKIVPLPFIRIDSVVQLTGLQEGVPTAFVIPFYNIGSDTIKIHHIETFCGCLQSDVAKESIAPADSSVLIMSINPLNRGHMIQQMYMYVENKPEPLRIMLKGFVK